MKKVNSQTTPIYRNSGFFFESLEQIEDAFARNTVVTPEDGYIYSRYDNPTVVDLERRIAEMEQGRYSIAAPSGMAAIDIALSAFEKPSGNRWLFFTEIYGGTNYYIKNVLNDRRGIDTMHLEPENGGYDVEYVAQAIARLKPDVLYFEPVTNPMLIVCNGREIIARAKQMGVRVVVDNTFATPYLWQPLTDGADIVLHSTTKYFSGHGDLAGGVLTMNDEQIYVSAKNYRKFCGMQPSPDDAARLLSYLDSFECRFACQIDNAQKLAHYLNESKQYVENVIYPGLEGDISNSIARDLFRGVGYGAIVTFQIRGGRAAAARFIELLRGEINVVPTLGDAHTIMMPIAQVWGDKYPEQGYFRVSVGTEPFHKIEKNVKKAFENLGVPK